MAEAKWYVVHTYSGYENKVKANIEKTIENNKHLAEQILEVRVPMQDVVELKNGVKDLVFDLEAQTVTVTYDANKTDVPALQKAFAKIGKPATTTAPEHKHDEHQHHGHQH